MTQEETEKVISIFLEKIEGAVKSKYYKYIILKEKAFCKLHNKEIRTLEEGLIL
jgi:hypothetical protein